MKAVVPDLRRMVSNHGAGVWVSLLAGLRAIGLFWALEYHTLILFA